MTLDELAIKHGTDKSSLSHSYCEHYEKHLPKKINNFLEIGTWKGAGIKMFKDYYDGKGKFFALDRFSDGYGLVTIGELQAVGINAYHGSQDDFWFLESIKEEFSVIVDDASHHWLSQINTFRIMFVKNLESGGVYVMEDVFDEPYWGQGIIKDKKENFKGLCEQFLEKGTFESEFVTKEESDIICPMIEEINIYNEIVFVKKKC